MIQGFIVPRQVLHNDGEGGRVTDAVRRSGMIDGSGSSPFDVFEKLRNEKKGGVWQMPKGANR